MMEQRTSMYQEQGVDQSARVNSLCGVGRALSDARERAGMSVEDVAGRLKFAPRQISALEEEDFARLPEMAFVRGFVRSYAKLLQLDEVALLGLLPGAAAQVEVAEEKSTAATQPTNVYEINKSSLLWIAAALLLAVMIVVAVSWQDAEPEVAKTQAEEKHEMALAPAVPVVEIPVVASAVFAVPAPEKSATASTTPAATTPAAKPVISPKPVVSPPINRPVRALRLEFDEDSWVEVRDGNGKILLSFMGVQGSEQGVSGTPPFAVTIGHAAGVRLYYQGNLVELAPHTRVDVAHLKLE